MFRTTLLLNLLLLVGCLPVDPKEEEKDTHCIFKDTDHSIGDSWCDSDRCGFCRCLDVHVVMCDTTVGPESRYSDTRYSINAQIISNTKCEMCVRTLSQMSVSNPNDVLLQFNHVV